MPDEPKQATANATAPTAARHELARRRQELQARITEAENRLQALSYQMGQLREELAQLHGVGLTGLIYAAIGKRAATTARISEELEGYSQHATQCEEVLAALRQELESVNTGLAAAPLADAVTHEFPAATTSEPDAIAVSDLLDPQGVTKDSGLDLLAGLQKALEAGEEAVRDLYDEMTTAVKLGRRSVVAMPGILKTVVGAAKTHSRNECAERVRKSVQRFHRRLTGYLPGGDTSISPELAGAISTLEELAAGITRSTIAMSKGGRGEADRIEEHLRLINMLIEKEIIDTKKRLGHDAAPEIK